MTRLAPLVLCLPLALAARADDPPAGGGEKPVFPLKDGDTWVLLCDGTPQNQLHNLYFEAFCYARYPDIKFSFRQACAFNSPVSLVNGRSVHYHLAWKPTVVSVELGLYDSAPADAFLAEYANLIDRIRKAGARPVVFTTGPVNDGTTPAKVEGPNRLYRDYAARLKEYAAKEKIPFADKFHPLLDVWAKNYSRQRLPETLALMRTVAADDTMPGVEHLRAYLAAQEKYPTRGVNLQGEPSMPGPPGQLMMAAALLKALGADGFVSSATVDAATGKAGTTNCTVTDVKVGGGGVSFDRLDLCLPFPIAEEARSALPLAPDVLALSQYTLKVRGLADGDYTLAIDKVPCGRFTAKQLAAGINLTALEPSPQGHPANPIHAKMKWVLGLVEAKESAAEQWRVEVRKRFGGKPDPSNPPPLPPTRAVEKADEDIRRAATPERFHFDITPAPRPGNP